MPSIPKPWQDISSQHDHDTDDSAALSLSPQYQPGTSGSAATRRTTCPVRLNVDFGGPSGEKLALLNRIVGIFDNYYHMMRGMRFCYDDGTEQVYGPCRPRHESKHWEMSLVVDGKGGERVDGIRAVRRTDFITERSMVGGLQVCCVKHDPDGQH